MPKRKYKSRNKYDSYGNRYTEEWPRSKRIILARRKLKPGDKPPKEL